jgi:hypothetical protein
MAEHSTPKQTTFISTFSQNGYEKYGATWIKTFLENTSNVRARLYVDFDIPNLPDRIEVLSFTNAVPHHASWVEQYRAAYVHQDPFEREHGVRFSYKAFVMMHALENISGFIVWVDGDCLFKPNNFDFVGPLLNGSFLGCQIDKVALDDSWKRDEHIESGIVLFDADHPDKSAYLDALKQFYKPSVMGKMTKPYDGFALRRALSLSKVSHVDLFPKNYTVVTCNAESTCIHPELKSRFTHNMGDEGKLYYGK